MHIAKNERILQKNADLRKHIFADGQDPFGYENDIVALLDDIRTAQTDEHLTFDRKLRVFTAWQKFLMTNLKLVYSKKLVV